MRLLTYLILLIPAAAFAAVTNLSIRNGNGNEDGSSEGLKHGIRQIVGDATATAAAATASAMSVPLPVPVHRRIFSSSGSWSGSESGKKGSKGAGTAGWRTNSTTTTTTSTSTATGGKKSPRNVTANANANANMNANPQDFSVSTRDVRMSSEGSLGQTPWIGMGIGLTFTALAAVTFGWFGLFTLFLLKDLCASIIHDNTSGLLKECFFIFVFLFTFFCLFV